MTTGKEQFQPSLVTHAIAQINEFLSPADHLNQLSEESVSKHTDNNEFNLAAGPGSAYSEYVGTKSEHAGQEISEATTITSESNEEFKFVQEESSWIGSRISRWFGLESNLDKKVAEPTDQPLQLNSFKSRKIALDYSEDIAMSEVIEELNNDEHYEDKENLGSEKSGWIGGLSKLFSSISDSPEDVLSTNDDGKNKDKNEIVKSYSIDDSTDSSKIIVSNLENKISDLSVSDELGLTEKTSKNTNKDTQNLMNNDRLSFDLTDKLRFRQIKKAENSGISKETESVGEENAMDNDDSKTWWFRFNTIRDTFRFSENSEDQTSSTSEETQNIGSNNKDYTKDIDGSKPSPWYHFGLTETLGFGQSNEDQAATLQEEPKENIDEGKENILDNHGSKSQWFHFGLSDILMSGQTNKDHLASDPLEKTKKNAIEDNENTMNSESEDNSLTHIMNQVPSEGDALIVDSLINKETIQYPELSQCTMENDISCQSEGLQQAAKEHREIKSENTQSLVSTNGLKNSFNFDGITSKFQDVKLKVQNLQKQNLMPDSKLMGHNKPMTQEHLQEHLKFSSEIEQHSSGYMSSVTHENLHIEEKLHREQEVLHNHDLISVEEYSVVSKDEPLIQEQLSEEEQRLMSDSELTPAGDPRSKTILLTGENSVKLPARDKLQAEETLQQNLVSRLESEQLISNATDSMPLTTLQNQEKFSQEHIVMKSDLQQITIIDNQLPEEELHHEQHISQQQHVTSTMEFEQFDISDNSKLLSQAQTYIEQQHFNSEFDELSKFISSSQDESENKEAITQGQHLTSAKQQFLDHNNPLSKKDKLVLEEMYPSGLVDKQIIATNTYDPSLQEQLCDETQRIQSLQPATDHTRALPQEKLYSDRTTLQQQAPVLDSESNQLTLDHGEAELQECLHGEENVFKKYLPLKSESNRATPDGDKSFSPNKHNGQDLKEHQVTYTSEPNWLSISDHSKYALSEKLHVNKENLQPNVLTPLQSEQHTDSVKYKLLLKEKMDDKDCALQKQCRTSNLASKLFTITDNTESLLQDNLEDKEQTLPDPLSSSQYEKLTVSNDGKTLTRENSFNQQKNLGDKGVTLESVKQSAVLVTTEDLSREETNVTNVSNTTINSEKRNKMHRSMEPESPVELVNSLLSENVNHTEMYFGGDKDTDTKIEPQQIAEETRKDKMNDNYWETNSVISEKETQPSIDPVSANLWKVKTQGNSGKLIATSTHKKQGTNQLSTALKTDPEAATENVNEATSASTENKHKTGDIADKETEMARDIESNDHQTGSFSFWGIEPLLDEAKNQFEKLRVKDTSFDSTNFDSNLKFLRKHMSIAHLQYLERCFEKAKLLWLEGILEHLENENCNNDFNNILQNVNTFEESFWQNKDFKCDKNAANIDYRMIERQHSEDTEMFQKLQDILTAIKMKCTSNVSSSSSIKDGFSSRDTLEAGLTNNEQSSETLGKNGQMNKDVQEQKGTKDIISEVTERQILELPTLNLSDKIPDSEKAHVKVVMESKLGNRLQKDPHDIKKEKTTHQEIEEKVISSALNKDFDEVKKLSVIVDSRVEVATENNNKRELSIKKKAALDLQTIRIQIGHFIKNFYQKVMDMLSGDPGATLNLRGTYTELFLIPAVVGVVTALLFIQRTCQAIKSRRYLGREKQLAGTVSQLLDEKCKVLERLNDCTQKYKEFEASVKNAADLKESTETRTLHLQDTYAKLDKSNSNLRQTIDQCTQDLEEEKQIRSQNSNLITEIQANLIALENEALNLKVQVEEAKNELKGIPNNDSRHQESFQTAQEENYHIKQSKEQLLQESEGWEERYSDLNEQIKLCEKSQKDTRSVLASKENEVKTLTSCLLKMKLWNPAEEDHPAEEMSEEQQKQKVEKLIYVAKLNAGLKSVEEERNQIHSKLYDEIKAKQELMERVEKLQLEKTSVQHESTQFETEYKTIQQKLKIMTELYHEKEMELQRNLTLEEHQRLQKEEKLSEVDEKINQVTEELSLYRQRAKDLEEELDKTIQSYKNQIVSHEKKAHDNWLSAREADRELGNIKRENSHLRQKITEAEFKMETLVNDISGRPALLSSSTFVPPYRGRSSPYGPSPVGRPGSESVGFLSPPLVDGPLRFSPLFPGRPDFKTQGPSGHPDHTSNENADSFSDRMSDHHGPQSDSGSLSPVWERERKLLEALSGEHPALEDNMQISNSALVCQTQDHDTLNISLNQSLPPGADFGIRPGFAPAPHKQIPSLPVDPRGHFLQRGLPLRPHSGIYGLPERIPLRAFGLPPNFPMRMRDPAQPGAYPSHLPPPRPIFLPHRQLPDITSGLLPSRIPLPKFSETEHQPSSQEK
ncbi:cTAGE family member 5 [Cetorhinus maximus]